MAAASLAVLGISVAISVVAIFAIGDLHESSRLSAHSSKVLAQSALVERLVVDLQTGQRGYIITGEPAFLEPWRSARTALPGGLGTLDRLVLDNPAQYARAWAIDRAVRSYLTSYSDPLVRLVRAGHRAEAGAIVRDGEGKQLVDALRGQFSAFNAIEEGLRRARDSAARSTGDRAIAIVIGGLAVTAALITLLLGYLSLLVVRPVARITATARRMAAGDLAARVTRVGSGEVADLGGAFDELAAAVEQSQAQLTAERSMLEAIVTASPLATVVLDLDGKVTAWNLAAASILGWSKDEIVGMVPAYIPAQTRAPALAVWKRVLAGDSVVPANLMLVRRDGTPVEVRSWSRALPGPDGRPTGMISLFEDAGERLRAERELARMFELSSDLVCIFGLDGFFKRVNPAFERILGYPVETLLETRALDLSHPDDRDRRLAVMQQLIQGEAVHGFEARTRCADGSYRWLRWNSVPVPAEGVAYAIAHDITDAKLLESEIAASRDEALRATEAKSEFLSRMSHELRTPLNAILGFGQLLELEAAWGPNAVESVEQILKAGRHLLELINEVLDISRIEAGHLTISSEPVAVANAIAYAAELMEPLAAERAVSLLREHADAAAEHVVVDRQRLAQILLNLLSNAIKYSPDGGTVVIGAEHASPQRIRLFVRDSGPGIAPALLERLFVPFDRLGEADPTVPGTGLGLALSNRLAAAMGGVLGIDSIPGQGATFWVEFDRAEDPVAAYPGEMLERTLPPAVDGTAEQLTVLYIEDNLSNLRLIELILTGRPGVRLLSAMQGRLGLDLAREHAPDVVVLDLHLPDISGHEVLRRLRQHPQTAAIPVVILSADATPGQIERLLAEGARAFLTKPIDVKEFIEVLARLSVDEVPE